MDKLGTTLCRVAKLLDRQRINASAAPVSRIENGHLLARAPELAASHQARSAGTDDQELRRMQRIH